MGFPFIGSKFVAPSLFRSSFRSSSDRRRKRSSPQRPTNMFLFTKAASFPKTSRTVTLGSSGRMDLKNSLEPSSGRGIFNVSSASAWVVSVEHSSRQDGQKSLQLRRYHIRLFQSQKSHSTD